MGEERGKEGAVGMRRVGMIGLPVILPMCVCVCVCVLISIRLYSVVCSRDVRIIDIDS